MVMVKELRAGQVILCDKGSVGRDFERFISEGLGTTGSPGSAGPPSFRGSLGPPGSAGQFHLADPFAPDGDQQRHQHRPDEQPEEAHRLNPADETEEGWQ